MESPADEHSLLVIFAHPDEGTFRTGGMLALLAHAGGRVQVLTDTRRVGIVWRTTTRHT